MVELKPCPFCGRGGADDEYPIDIDRNSDGEYELQCLYTDDCGAMITLPTLEAAIAAWNTRPTTPPDNGAVDEQGTEP